jgi:alanine racemase
VVKAEARVLQVRDVEAGAAAGYGATWTASGPCRLATLSIGYADGFSRLLGSAQGAGRICINGHSAPIAGRVSMDLLIVDVSQLPQDAVKRGDFAQLIGPEVPLEEVAARAGTIGYEVLTSLGDRYARHYTGASASAES